MKEVIFNHTFNQNDKPYYLELVASLMKYFTIQYQETFPYHINDVKSNDALYKEDEFRAAIIENLLSLVEHLFAELSGFELNFTGEEKCKYGATAMLGISTYLNEYFEPTVVITKLQKMLLATGLKFITKIATKSTKSETKKHFKRIVDDLKHIKKKKFIEEVKGILAELDRA